MHKIHLCQHIFKQRFTWETDKPKDGTKKKKIVVNHSTDRQRKMIIIDFFPLRLSTRKFRILISFECKLVKLSLNGFSDETKYSSNNNCMIIIDNYLKIAHAQKHLQLSWMPISLGVKIVTDPSMIQHKCSYTFHWPHVTNSVVFLFSKKNSL